MASDPRLVIALAIHPTIPSHEEIVQLYQTCYDYDYSMKLNITTVPDLKSYILVINGYLQGSMR